MLVKIKSFLCSWKTTLSIIIKNNVGIGEIPTQTKKIILFRIQEKIEIIFYWFVLGAFHV